MVQTSPRYSYINVASKAVDAGNTFLPTGSLAHRLLRLENSLLTLPPLNLLLLLVLSIFFPFPFDCSALLDPLFCCYERLLPFPSINLVFQRGLCVCDRWEFCRSRPRFGLDPLCPPMERFGETGVVHRVHVSAMRGMDEYWEEMVENQGLAMIEGVDEL